MQLAKTIAELKSKFRTPIVAEIGGFRPPNDPTSSWFGAGCALPEETIPQHESRDMFPLLQINTSELPEAVEHFGKSRLLVVYISNVGIPFDKPHGDGWLIREYESTENLQPVNSEKPSHLKPFPIKWRTGIPERPGWEESWELVDMNLINAAEDGIEKFHKLPHHYGTKIGGFPSEIQHMISGADNFVFQIGSEEKPRWMWVDNGVATFSKTNGEWDMEVQFY